MPARESDGGDAGVLVTPRPGTRARRGDPGVYEAEVGEMVRVTREPGAKFSFIRYDTDKGGDFAVVIGGLHGHRIERCVTVDRVQPYSRRRKTRTVS